MGPAATRVIRLSRAQMRVFKSRARFRILNAGRRFGKTHLAAIELFTEAQNNPGSISWYVAPTYRQAQQIMWTKLKELVPAGYIRSKNETDLRIEFKNGSIIALRGSDNPDSLRGVGLDLVILDEVAFQKQEVWTKILRAALSDKMGRALFISTPCGYNWFYDLYRKAKTAPDWGAFQFTTIEGGNVPMAEIEAARAELDEKTFRQEYEASFEALTGRVYYAFDRDKNGVKLEDNPKLPLLVGMDFNVNPMSAAIAVRNGDQVHFIGEISIPNGNTEEMCRAIKARYPEVTLKTGARKVRVYPDPTGNARKTSAPVGQTDFTIIRAAGFEVLAPSHPYPVSDKLNTVNAAFKSASGTMRAFVDPGKCPELSKGFDGLTFKEGTNDPDKSLGLDHMTDAAAYLILWELPLRQASTQIRIGAG